MKYTVLILFSILSVGVAIGQDQNRVKLDSIRQAILLKQPDSSRINSLILLSDEYKNINMDSSLIYANRALEKSKKLGWLQGEFRSVFTVGNLHRRRGKFEWALTSFNSLLNSGLEHSDSIAIANAYSGLATTYLNMNANDKALKNINLAIPIYERLQVLDRLPICYNIMGNVLNSQKKYNDAILWYQKTLAAALRVNNKTIIAYTYSNSGIVYNELKQYSKALENMFLALKMEKETGDTYGVATEYASIGDVFLQLYLNSSDEKTGVRSFLDSAIFYTLLSIKLCKKIDDQPDLVNVTFKLSNLYNLKKEYKKALELYKEARILEDSIFSREKQNQIQEVELKQEARLQEKEIEIRNLQILKEKREKIFLISVLVLLGIAIAAVFKTLQKQKRINRTLKETQQQLIQQEKLASLGELTAGIAHEIQNPLNFVNNFSEVSSELLDEMNIELEKGEIEEAKAIAADVKQNLEKIHHHGKRADAIVKGMLQHSRSSSGQKEPTDINALCDEYLRLCYHGLRAKDKSFNASMKTDFDPNIPKINVIPQDIGRVILNLLTNAFYAVNERHRSTKGPTGFQNLSALNAYEPTVTITTRYSILSSGEGRGEVIISDNGNGIPQKVIDKIFQPFFTTKPTGQGTGLGLSLSYDIVTKGHGGELKVETKEGEGTIFIIVLPIT